jgi:SlyX protein
MTPEQLEHRLADLETRVAFQEQALLELSDALAAARDEEAARRCCCIAPWKS